MAMESPMSEDSPMMDVSTPTTSPTSVQHYRSQFIKEGLKMKVKQKLVASKSKKDTSGGGGGGGPSSSKKANNNTPAAIPTFSIEDVDSNSSSEHGFVQSKALIKKEELTEEDEMRRQRRRERNKVAATKCRNKKKLRTQMLMKVDKEICFINTHLYVLTVLLLFLTIRRARSWRIRTRILRARSPNSRWRRSV